MTTTPKTTSSTQGRTAKARRDGWQHWIRLERHLGRGSRRTRRAGWDHNTQENTFIGQYVGNQIVQAQPAPVAWPVRVGDVPQMPPAFQPRQALLSGAGQPKAGRAVVHAVTGMRGVGKTQVAAAYARSQDG